MKVFSAIALVIIFFNIIDKEIEVEAIKSNEIEMDEVDEDDVCANDIRTYFQVCSMINTESINLLSRINEKPSSKFSKGDMNVIRCVLESAGVIDSNKYAQTITLGKGR